MQTWSHIYDAIRCQPSDVSGYLIRTSGCLIWHGLTNHSRFAYSRFAYSRFAYDLSRFAYSHFAYPRFACTQTLPLSRFAYSALRIKNTCQIKKCFKIVSKVSLLKLKEQNICILAIVGVQKKLKTSDFEKNYMNIRKLKRPFTKLVK